MLRRLAFRAVQGIALALATLLQGPSPVCAESPSGPTSPAASPTMPNLSDRAALHFQAGQAHQASGAYDDAVREFQAAYELSEQPQLLFHLYQAHEGAGNLKYAIDHLERFLNSGAELAPARRQALEARLAHLRRPMETSAAAPSATAEPAPPPAMPSGEIAPADEGGGLRLSMPALVSLAAGGAGLVTFAIFGILSNGEDSDLAESCGADAGARCSDDDVSTLKTYNTVADLGLIVALVGGGLGTYFLLTGDGEESAGPAVSTWLGPERAGITVRGRL